jgi:hypothetical protein
MDGLGRGLMIMNILDILGFVVVYQNLHLKLHLLIDLQLSFVIIIYMQFHNRITLMEIKV